MLNNFRNFQSLLWSHGGNWLLFRAGYAFRRRTGLLRRQMPAYKWKDRSLDSWLKSEIPSEPEAYAHWRRQHSPKFSFESIRAERSAGVVEAQISRDVPWNPQIAVDEAERILNGELKYFAHKWIETGFPPNWHREPISGITLDSEKHWSAISDDGGDVDIKFIWEPSRFNMVYTLVRAYAAGRDEKFAEAFWVLLESWAESNPPNTGPNWMDGQEAALRLLAWTFGFYAFLDSPSTTPERVAQFIVMVAAHAERIHKNIDYAISTHSNHTISEAFGLWLVGLLFPELKEAEKYLALGRKLLEQEAAAQIFPDGAYSMYSLNYHRFVLHLYLAMIRLAELNQSPVPSLLVERISASINFLLQLIDPETGQMSVYGSNDGALVLPLNYCDFTDYRPLLQLGWYVTQKQLLFDPGPWDEDLYWLYGADSLSQPRVEPGSGEDGNGAFPHGGIYILRNANSKAFIRCTNWTRAGSRPSHADHLHVDLWWRGVNIACDAGTYLYSGAGIWRNGLAYTSVHNTVTVDHQDQMRRVSRFTWTDPSRGKALHHSEKRWQGEHDGYYRLPDPVYQQRTVISLGADRWLVVDRLDGKQKHHYALHWLLCDGEYKVQEASKEHPAAHGILLSSADSRAPDSNVLVLMGLLNGKSVFSIVRGDENSRRGWRSRYYGEKEPAISAMLETDQPRVCFWTFFGFEGDMVQIEGEAFKLRSPELTTSIDIQTLVLA